MNERLGNLDDLNSFLVDIKGITKDTTDVELADLVFRFTTLQRKCGFANISPNKDLSQRLINAFRDSQNLGTSIEKYVNNSELPSNTTAGKIRAVLKSLRDKLSNISRRLTQLDDGSFTLESSLRRSESESHYGKVSTATNNYEARLIAINDRSTLLDLIAWYLEHKDEILNLMHVDRFSIVKNQIYAIQSSGRDDDYFRSLLEDSHDADADHDTKMRFEILKRMILLAIKDDSEDKDWAEVAIKKFNTLARKQLDEA